MKKNLALCWRLTRLNCVILDVGEDRRDTTAKKNGSCNASHKTKKETTQTGQRNERGRAPSHLFSERKSDTLLDAILSRTLDFADFTFRGF